MDDFARGVSAGAGDGGADGRDETARTDASAMGDGIASGARIISASSVTSDEMRYSYYELRDWIWDDVE